MNEESHDEAGQLYKRGIISLKTEIFDLLLTVYHPGSTADSCISYVGILTIFVI